MEDTRQYEEVLKLIDEKDYEKAVTLLADYIESIKDKYPEKEDAKYYSFNHVVELYIYSYYERPQKEILFTELKMHEFYRVYAYVLAHIGEYEKALAAVNTSLEWNPVDIDTMFEKCEILRNMNRLEDFLAMTKIAYRYAFSRATMARIYRNYGYYYVEKLEPDTGAVLYQYSNIYYETENANNELGFIINATGRPLIKRNVKEMQEIIIGKDIPPGPDSDTIGIVFRVGQLLLGDGDIEPAKDCFSIVYDITQDEEVGEVLWQLSQNGEE